MTELGLTSPQPSPVVASDQNITSKRRRFALAERRFGRQHVSLSPEVVAGMVKAMDVCLILVAAAAAPALYLGIVLNSEGGWGRYLLTSLLGAAVFVVGFQRINGYTLKQLSMLRWQLTRAATVWAVAVSVLLLMAFVGKMSETYSRGWTLGWSVTALALILVERGIVRLVIARWMRHGYLRRNIVVVGAGEPGERLIAKLRKSQDESIVICGVFDDRRSRVPHSVCGCSVLGNTDDLLHFARQVPIQEVIIALPLSAEERLNALIDKLRLLPIDLRLSAEPIAGMIPVRGISYVGAVPLLEIIDRPLKHWDAVAKWVEDKVLSAVFLFLLAPAMAIIALLIKLDSWGPVFFVQERFGFNNDVIRVLKFRTMYVDRGDISGAQRTRHNDPRVTRVGRILRALSLDELPQLLNVLRGDMSLVGPRPHPIAMKAGDRLYHDAIKEYVLRHRVKPGITGWAQVNGSRGEIDTLEKARARVEHDLLYIEHWTLWLDIRTLALTFRVLLSRRDAY